MLETNLGWFLWFKNLDQLCSFFSCGKKWKYFVNFQNGIRTWISYFYTGKCDVIWLTHCTYSRWIMTIEKYDCSESAHSTFILGWLSVLYTQFKLLNTPTKFTLKIIYFFFLKNKTRHFRLPFLDCPNKDKRGKHVLHILNSQRKYLGRGPQENPLSLSIYCRSSNSQGFWLRNLLIT